MCRGSLRVTYCTSNWFSPTIAHSIAHGLPHGNKHTCLPPLDIHIPNFFPRRVRNFNIPLFGEGFIFCIFMGLSRQLWNLSCTRIWFHPFLLPILTMSNECSLHSRFRSTRDSSPHTLRARFVTVTIQTVEMHQSARCHLLHIVWFNVTDLSGGRPRSPPSLPPLDIHIPTSFP